ncbi:hypothetical protein RB614_40445 [Phytohabitans sp. ZYX-F-186]|uniref:SWIM-type domain-containing protein n=1 Tax=Phytohabitans maris TaxID=3071409 RepID=A0ABU0ZUZ0_9ACTN|nr:hypothetical protein [Phytohabitans sp. ZYX-F-186]MDQ7910780.1 hypothetical protein [Phytohabitans sp. ZYX-F-186]
MSRESAASKAARYLAEGRLVVLRVVPGEVDATCRGDGAVYQVTYRRGLWHCTCDARGRCSHKLALGLVVAPSTERYR